MSKTVDLSRTPASFGVLPGAGGGGGPSASSGPVPRGPSSGGPGSFGPGSSGPSARGPSSIEGGGSPLSLSIPSVSGMVSALSQRSITDLARQYGPEVVQLPRIAARTYQHAARRYLRPWGEFLRMRPGRIIGGFREARGRGEIQIHVQRNVLANTRRFCPNYIFMFMCTLFMFVMSSPFMLFVVGGAGGGWMYALRSDSFRNRPWALQMGGVSVNLGKNMKMGMMCLPTLLFLHFFMGPLLWSAAICSGSVSVAHAAVRDRDDAHDADDHGDAGAARIEELT